MKQTLALSAALLTALSFSATAEARPGLLDRAPDRMVHRVASSCYDVGQRVANQRGARLLRADAIGGGQCLVVLLVPDGEGGRPHKEEIVVPMR